MLNRLSIAAIGVQHGGVQSSLIKKKCNLDVPNGFAYYWHDLRKKQQYFSKRQQGDSGVIIWEAICYNRVANLSIVNGTLDSNKYCVVLAKCLLPFGLEEFLSNWIFQQDNAPCHGNKFAREFLFGSDVNVLPRPARSPDLNIIDNLSGTLSRSFYKDNKQLGSKESNLLRLE